MRLPEVSVGQTSRPEFHSLATRDLYPGHSVASPSGEAIARTVGLNPPTATELNAANTDWSGTPLWLYVLVGNFMEGQLSADFGEPFQFPAPAAHCAGVLRRGALHDEDVYGVGQRCGIR
jgi:hypothetical protein